MAAELSAPAPAGSVAPAVVAFVSTLRRAGVEVAEVFCLGNCALGPSGTLDGRLHGRLSAERLDVLTEGWR